MKMAAKHFIDKEFEWEDNSGDEIEDEEHGKLLRSVHMMDSNQRIKPPTRTEPSLNVSEFNLAPVGDGAVRLKDLALSLESQGKAYNAEVAKKLQNLTKKSKTLETPLEKSAADKVKRIVTYQNLKKQVDRWEAIVETNKVARTMRYPMEIEPLSVNNTAQLAAKWRSQSQTPLEAELNRLHGESKIYEEDKKEQEEFLLTLQELREKRKEMAKFRAQQSYQEAKFRRLKKIKSKKFHRIMRREKMQKQLKDFETLQKTDPEAALKQLEQLEKIRAEERMTLRHKSTGHWARSRLIRAKYDPQTRMQLAEQLAISRDLTKKTKVAESSDEDEVVAEVPQNGVSKTFATDEDNPWVKTTSEIEEFVSGYKKYWEEQNKKENTILKDAEEHEEEKESLTEFPESVNTCANDENQEHSINQTVNEVGNGSNINSQSFIETMHNEDILIPSESFASDSENMVEEDVIINNQNKNEEYENCGDKHFFMKKKVISSKEIVPISILKSKSTRKLKCKKNALKKPKTKVRSTSKCWVVTPITENTNVLPEAEDVGKVAPDDRVRAFLASMLPEELEKEEKRKKKKKSALEKMFETVENNISLKTQQKLNDLKADFALSDNVELGTSELKNYNENDDLRPSLAFNNLATKRLREDIELVEESSKDNNSANTTANIASKASNINSVGVLTGGHIENDWKSPVTNINPEKFIPAKPKTLLTAAPELVTAGEEALDDEMEDDNQFRTISEAFADDDVVDTFRKEKEEEIEKSKPKDIDLNLPGWGAWGGAGIENKKKSRFILKAPPLPPRRDEDKSNVIIMEEKATGIKKHQVCELPTTFRAVKEFEASIRAPIGTTWIPHTAHRKLTAPEVITKMGTVIKPMSDEFLVNKKVLFAEKE